MDAATMTAPTETAANYNRASAGFSHDVVIAMLAGIEGQFYADVGNASNQVRIGERRNDKPEHGAKILAAAARLRSLGLKVRVFEWQGKPDYLHVYGPKQGGAAGRYSR